MAGKGLFTLMISIMNIDALCSRSRLGCIAVLLACSCLVVSTGCKKRAAVAGPPAPAVTVAHPVQREVIEWDEFTGRLEAVETVEVRARVSGFVEKADFQEGTLVK